MLNELDERINNALIFLSNAKDCTATAYELEPGRECFSNINIVKFLIELDLAIPVQTLNLSPDCCRISKKGADIQKYGGWIKHIESLNSEKQIQLKKDNLDLEIKVLQKDNLEHEKTIRAQNDRIRNLEEQIKFISLIKLYWWLIPILISIGIFLKVLWDTARQD